MDEVFGEDNFCSQIYVFRNLSFANFVRVADVSPTIILWYRKEKPGAQIIAHLFADNGKPERNPIFATSNYRMVETSSRSIGRDVTVTPANRTARHLFS